MKDNKGKEKARKGTISRGGKGDGREYGEERRRKDGKGRKRKRARKKGDKEKIKEGRRKRK